MLAICLHDEDLLHRFRYYRKIVSNIEAFSLNIESIKQMRVGFFDLPKGLTDQDVD